MVDQKSDTHQPLETWKLNCIMAFFILLTASRFVSTKLIDTEQVTDKDGNVIEYKHPLLQSVLCYLGEFLVIVIIGTYYKLTQGEKDDNLRSSTKVSCWQLMLPAFLDFIENGALIFGMTQIFPSLVSISRALVLPITALLSKFFIRKFFSWSMLFGLTLLLGGMTLASYVQFDQEMSLNEYNMSWIGVFLLILSALL